MKKTMLSLFALLLLTATQAQLLKKLKDKAVQSVDKKTSESTTAGSPASASNEASAAGNGNASSWSPTPADVKTFSLEDNETLLYDETRIIAVNNQLNYAFVTRNNRYEYFLIDNGQRSGPFKEAPIAQLKARVEKAENGEEEDNGSSGNEDAFNMGTEMKDPVSQKHTRTINGKLHLVFNGKNYGPYDFVNKMEVSPDGKKFWAVVVIGGDNSTMTSMGMGHLFLVNEAGTKKPIPQGYSMPARLLVSNQFSAAALMAMNMEGQKAVVASSSGKSLNTTMAELYSGRKPLMMVSEAGDIISVPAQSPTQLMVNGTEVAVFAVPVKSMNRLFLLPDYKKSVYYAGGKLYRGDGGTEGLKGVLFPKTVTLNGETALYYFKVHQPGNGAKDVYLCKKVL
jgi:hypothetical protein